MSRTNVHDAVRCLAAAAIWLSLWLWMAWVPSARAAAPAEISRAAFQAQVARLQGVVAACEAAPAACNGDSVGNDVAVGDTAHGGFEEHWQWLRTTLNKAKTAKGSERATMLRDAREHLTEIAAETDATPDAQQAKAFLRARAQANAVLSRPEFQRGGGPTWWDRAKAWFVAWIERLFLGVAQVGAAAPWLGTLLEWLFFIAAAAGLLFLLLRNISRQRLRVSLGDAALQRGGRERDADDWVARASQHAAAQEWRDAVHCIYWAAIVLLETQRAWRHDPARTPREYVRLLKPASPQQRSLRRLTQIFEGVWYGLRDADAALYSDARSLYDGLAADRTEPSSARGTSDATLASGGAA